ncbi:MAG: hypothetical protein K0R61_1457 [Microvirga sp.]|nr:hypothetical protein [Microvirga sp.]
MVQASAIDLFVATIIPGAIAVLMFMAYVTIRVWLDPTLVPPRLPSHSGREILVAIAKCMPLSGLIVAIIGGMYFGVVTPTEAAALGCLLSFAFALAYRELTRSALWTACVNSIAVTCVISIIIINGQILGFAVTQAGIGRGLSRALVELGLSPFAFFVFLFFLYVALGAMLEGISMMLLTVPVIYPTLKAMGFDDVWFGVILVIQAELAQLSPPIGLNLFAVQSIAGDASLAEITRASVPYALMLSALCFLLYFWPELALWLPRTMKS